VSVSCFLHANHKQAYNTTGHQHVRGEEQNTI
jgi:hypothetical protein